MKDKNINTAAGVLNAILGKAGMTVRNYIVDYHTTQGASMHGVLQVMEYDRECEDLPSVTKRIKSWARTEKGGAEVCCITEVAGTFTLQELSHMASDPGVFGKHPYRFVYIDPEKAFSEEVQN